jgi:hypothetical protein
MPVETINKMGIVYKTTPDEKLRQKDQDLLTILYSLLSVENKSLVKECLGDNYINYLEKKAERIEAAKDGKIINLSEI